MLRTTPRRRTLCQCGMAAAVHSESACQLPPWGDSADMLAVVTVSELSNRRYDGLVDKMRDVDASVPAAARGDGSQGRFVSSTNGPTPY